MTCGRLFFVVAVALIAMAVNTHRKLFQGADAYGRFESTAACEKANGTPELVHLGDKYMGWRCKL